MRNAAVLTFSSTFRTLKGFAVADGRISVTFEASHFTLERE